MRGDGIGFDLSRADFERALGLVSVERKGAALSRAPLDSLAAWKRYGRRAPDPLAAVSGMKRPRVLLADDHTVILDGLRSILEPEFEVVGAVEDGRALLSAVEQLKPDVTICDISMPLLNGLDATRQIKKSDPQAKIIVLTMHPDVSIARDALKAGASGYLLKNSSASEIVMAIQQVLKGRVYLSPLVTKDVLDSYLEAPQEPADLPAPLTEREREVLQLVAEGRSHKEVAGVLNISVKTAQFHRYSLMKKLGLRTTAELTQYAIKHGIISV